MGKESEEALDGTQGGSGGRHPMAGGSQVLGRLGGGWGAFLGLRQPRTKPPGR